MPDQCGAGIISDICRKRNEAPAHNPHCNAFNVFTPGRIQVMMEAPEQSCPGRDFDQAVQTKANQRDGPGDDSSYDGNQTFGAVVGDGEVLKPLAPANDAPFSSSSRTSASMRWATPVTTRGTSSAGRSMENRTFE